MTSKVLKFGAYAPKEIRMVKPILRLRDAIGYKYIFETKSKKYYLSVLLGYNEAFGFYSNGVDEYEIALMDKNGEFIWIPSNVIGYATNDAVLKILEEN